MEERFTRVLGIGICWVFGAALGLGTLGIAPGGRPARAVEPGPGDLAGRVVDDKGAAVAGARVWALEGLPPTTQAVAEATTDGNGRFVLVDAWTRIAGPRAQTASLFVRGPDDRLGWLHMLLRNNAERNQFEIKVGPVAEARGRLADQDGRPVAGVTLTAKTLSRSADRPSPDFVWLSPELGATLQATTGADGAFVLKGIPVGARVLAAAAAPSHGSPDLSWDTTGAPTFKLDSRLGRIEGRLTPPDDRGFMHRLPLRLYTSRQARVSPDRPLAVIVSRTIETEPDGSFRVEGLPPGRYTLDAYFTQAGIVAARPTTELEVKPGTVARLEIPLQRVPRISGRVLDAGSGRGVAGVRLRSFLVEQPRNMHVLVGEATTDADGRYAVEARPGKVQLELALVPKTHLRAGQAEIPAFELSADREGLEIKLRPAVGLDGKVVDATGKPAANAHVYLLTVDSTRTFVGGDFVRTGRDGAFHFDQVDPDDRLSLWARDVEATTKGTVVVRPRQVEGKLVLTIDPKHAARLRGVAVDEQGRPVAAATVNLWWQRPITTDNPKYQHMSTGSVLATHSTGADGRFEFRGLWPGLRYQAKLEAKGRARTESAQVLGEAGKTMLVGKVELMSTSGRAAGRVVGSDGKPIAGARVFNQGDGPGRVSQVTDSEGRFRLEGMFSGSKYLFIHKDGYRFTGIRTGGDDDGLSVGLLRSSEPAPAWKPAAAASAAEQRDFAERILTRVWETFGPNAANNGALRCIDEMAALDPVRAQQWSAEHGNANEAEIRQAEARRLAATDAKGAIELLSIRPDRFSQWVLQELAERFKETDREKALAFAEAALEKARTQRPPERCSSLARSASLLIGLGRVDDGRALLAEAAREAGQLGAGGRENLARGEVAAALAPFDVAQALALIEPVPHDGIAKDRYRGWIARAIARTDLPRAIALLETVGGPAFYHELAKTGIAHEIGADRPDEAIKLIESMRSKDDSRWQAEAFGWLAVALAPRDRTRAFSLIDRALSMVVDVDNAEGNGFAWRPMTESAARIAVCARKAGYPDMDSVVMRVLATRPRHDFHDRPSTLFSVVQAAIPLAMVDPGAARTLLLQVEPQIGLDFNERGRARQAWLVAWALVDLEKAEEIFEVELARLADDKNPDLWNAGFFQAARLLATPPERREEWLGELSSGGYWWPGNPFL